MMTCLRCGQQTPRLTPHQIHCPRCAAEVASIMAADAKRRRPRFPARDMTGRQAL